MLMALRKSGWSGRVRSGSAPFSQSLKVKVWPTDIDIFMHMTNTRYLDVMTLSTNILMSKAGLEKDLHHLGAHMKQIYSDLDVYSMLRMFQSYTIESKISGADNGLIAFSHTFRRGKKINGRGDLLFSIAEKDAPKAAIDRSKFLPDTIPPLPENMRDWLGRDRLNPPVNE
ncbi:MAG: thioesterase family protein [Pseudomonadota bacterium]